MINEGDGMKLLIIRHGQSEADILNVHEGRADFELTELGVRQAQAMADRVAREYDVKRIYSSTLKRARQTAEQLAKIVGMEVQEEPDLMEFNNGLLAGLTREEANEKYPRVSGLPVHAAVYGQESALEFRFRAERVLSRIISENSEDSTAAIFTHGGTINRLYQAFVRLPVDTDIAWSTGDTGIHEWHVLPGLRRIVMSNSLAHLEGVK